MSVNPSGLAKIEMNWTGEGKGDMGGTMAIVALSLKGNYDVELYKKNKTYYAQIWWEDRSSVVCE
jgi:hypothetical protein